MTYTTLVVHPDFNKFYAPVSMNEYIWGFSFDAISADWSASSTTTGNLIYPYTSMQFENKGDYAYVTNGFGNTLEAYKLNRGNTYLDYQNSVNLPEGCEARSINISEDNKYAFVSCSDSSGKTLTFELNNDGTIAGLVGTTSIPEANVGQAIVIKF